MTNLFYAQSFEGKLLFSNKRAIDNYLNSVDGKNLIVKLEKEKSIRSLNQNAYLWGIVYRVIAEHTGHSEQEIHEYMKRVCLPPQFKMIMGKEIKMPARTKELNKTEFNEYIEKISAEVSSMGIIIPPPIKEKVESVIAYPVNNLEPKI